MGLVPTRPEHVPVFINSRDRLTPLSRLVEWLENTGSQRIVIVDNESTYEPLVRYLESSPHTVLRLRQNLGPHASLWGHGILFEYARSERFVVSDCDVVPDPGCPGDAIEVLSWCLDRYPRYVKAGLGLRIDNIPVHYERRQEVLRWEEQFWRRPLRRGLFDAPVDTTFAIYRSAEQFLLKPALRTGFPYVAQHFPWYVDTSNLTDEDAYYARHCDPAINNWDVNGFDQPRLGRMTLNQAVRWRMHTLIKEERDSGARKPAGLRFERRNGISRRGDRS